MSNDYFQTFDMACCVALISSGFELVDLDKSDPRKVAFIFDNTPELEKATEAFWSDKLMVNARTYFDNIKMLKSRIYSE